MNHGIGFRIFGGISDGQHLFHQRDDGAPASRVKPVLQQKAHLMASAAVVDKYRLHAPVIRSILRQARGPFGAGKLFVKIGEVRKRQIDLLLCSVGEARIRPSSLKTNRLRPNLVLAAAHRRKRISPGSVGVHRGCKSLAHAARGNADSLKGLAVRGFYRPG
jgi:hypothetical protein